MTITINLNKDLDLEIKALNRDLHYLKEIEESYEIQQRKLAMIYKLLNNMELKLVCENIIAEKYLEKFDYQDLHSIYDTLLQFFENINHIKESIDIDIFFTKGNIIDISALKSKFSLLNRDKIYPDFDFHRLKELFLTPPTELKPQDKSSDISIHYEPFVVRKYLYAITQMVINEMDLLVGFVGSEGMGKSCACSQDMNLMYYLLKELKLIKYKYNIRDMWYNSLESFIQGEDMFFSEKFRILALDEGNELNRQDWQNENVKTFFQRLRRERFNQRIKFICLPQLSELMTAIVISRMNFIFIMSARDDAKTGTIDKGFCDFFIIPRSEYIYSPFHKKNISREQIIVDIADILDNKKSRYISQLPNRLLILPFKRGHHWGFSQEDYVRYLKESNKTFSVAKGVKLTEYQAFCYFVARPKIKEWIVDKDKHPEVYATLVKMDRQICKLFEENPDKQQKYMNLMELKKRKRDEDNG